MCKCRHCFQFFSQSPKIITVSIGTGFIIHDHPESTSYVSLDSVKHGIVPPHKMVACSLQLTETGMAFWTMLD